jgi:hypothetical protein
MNVLLLSLALLCQTRLDPQPGTHWPAGFAPNVASRMRLYDVQMTDRFAASIGWPHRLNGVLFQNLDQAGRHQLLDQQVAWAKEWGNPPLPGAIRLRPDQVPGYIRNHPEMTRGARPIPYLSPEERRGFGGGMTVMEAIRNGQRIRAARERAARSSERPNLGGVQTK